jgi:hypothetical protein
VADGLLLVLARDRASSNCGACQFIVGEIDRRLSVCRNERTG